MMTALFYRPAVIRMANPHAFALIAEKKSHCLNLDTDEWKTVRFVINRGVRIVGERMHDIIHSLF